MENYKNYKQYFIENETYKIQNKIKGLKEIYKMTKKEIEELEDWKKWRYYEHLTTKQSKLFRDAKTTELRKLLKKQIEKESIKLKTAKEMALVKYNEIKDLKDVDTAIFEIEWSSRRLDLGAYQTKCFCRVWYKNGAFESYDSNYTGGCGYDKPSSSLSSVCNKLLKILILKNDKKILNDTEKHYKYYACEPLYFQYGVGVSSYQTMFKNLGFKVDTIYHRNENITITIRKK